jgi:hypothetical protein
MAATANGPGPAGEIQTERGLSESQQLTLNAVRSYIDQHGIPPSFRDVMVVRQLASTSTIQAHFRHYPSIWRQRARIFITSSIWICTGRY